MSDHVVVSQQMMDSAVMNAKELVWLRAENARLRAQLEQAQHDEQWAVRALTIAREMLAEQGDKIAQLEQAAAWVPIPDGTIVGMTDWFVNGKWLEHTMGVELMGGQITGCYPLPDDVRLCRRVSHD